MAFGTMIVILLTGFMITKGWTITGIPTALLVIPMAIIGTVNLYYYWQWIDWFIDTIVLELKQKQNHCGYYSFDWRYVCYWRYSKIYYWSSAPQRFADGERFIFSVREFKAFTGLEQGIALKTSQFLTITIAILLVAFLFYFLTKN